MSKALPERPDLEQLKKQAKDLLNEVRAGQAEAVARVGKEDTAKFALNDAQRVLAREYGFPSWAKLKLHVETRELAIAGARLVVAACNGDTATLKALLAERPSLGQQTVSAAAALADLGALQARVKLNPEFARAKSGPCDTEALGYVCLGKLGGDEAARVACAELLLKHGADANATWFESEYKEGIRLPILYAATGRSDYPRLAECLLTAGAKPNDGESIYHAAEKHHVKCLEALERAGADFSARDPKWNNTALYFLLGWSPYAGSAKQARAGIIWLLDHGADPNVPSYERAEVPLHLAIQVGWDIGMITHLLDRGTNPNARRAEGKSELAFAVRAGRDDVVAFLRARGAADDATAEDRFLGACAAGNADAAARLLREHPAWREQLAEEVAALAHRSAQHGRLATIEVLAKLELPIDRPVATGDGPLHMAAWHGQAAVVRRLIALGADLSRVEKQYQATPLGWCLHGSLNCRAPSGDYPAAAEALLAAGAKLPPPEYGYGSPEVTAVVQRYLK